MTDRWAEVFADKKEETVAGYVEIDGAFACLKCNHVADTVRYVLPSGPAAWKCLECSYKNAVDLGIQL